MPEEGLMGLCQEIWRVLPCPMRMLRIKVIGNWESVGNRLTLVYLENGCCGVYVCLWYCCQEWHPA